MRQAQGIPSIAIHTTFGGNQKSNAYIGVVVEGIVFILGG